MCDPITIASVALTAASVAANSMAASQAGHARTAALQAERSRQNQLNQEASGINDTAQGRFKGFQDQQDAQQQNLASYYTGQDIGAPPPESALPTSSSNIVVDEQAKQDAKAKAFTDRTGTALAGLRAFGEALGADSRGTARDAGALGQVNNFKAGSSAVVPYELDAASQKGNGMKMVGDILGGLGKVGMSAGLSGGSFGNLFGGAPGVGSSATVATAANGNVPRLGMLY